MLKEISICCFAFLFIYMFEKELYPLGILKSQIKHFVFCGIYQYIAENTPEYYIKCKNL